MIPKHYAIRKTGGWWQVFDTSLDGFEIYIGCSSSWPGACGVLSRWTGRS